jgi:FixJ family two-component response regulator
MNLPAAYVVDDDAAMRRAMKGLLEVIGFAARSFESAEAFLEAYDPDWSGPLFVDLQLTGMNGLDLIEELDRRETRLRAILMTGHGNADTQVKRRQRGELVVLNKPFSMERLEAVLGEA